MYSTSSTTTTTTTTTHMSWYHGDTRIDSLEQPCNLVGRAMVMMDAGGQVQAYQLEVSQLSILVIVWPGDFAKNAYAYYLYITTTTMAVTLYLLHFIL